MNRSDSIAALAASLAKAQGQIEGAVKDKSNPAFRSRYADLGAVWEAIRHPLSSHGLSVLQQLSTEDNRVACTTMILHASGEWIEFAPFVVPVSKQDAQGFGSAATYCRRYSLMASIGIAPVDDDGEAAVGRGAQQSKQPEAKPAQAARDAAPKLDAGMLEAAQNAADGGRAMFSAYWRALTPAARSALAPHLDGLRDRVAIADAPPAIEVQE